MATRDYTMSTETSGVKAEFKYHAHINTKTPKLWICPQGLEIWAETQLY